MYPKRPELVVDSVCFVPCPTCSELAFIGFMLLTSDGDLMGFARCHNCFVQYGDESSCRFRVEVELSDAASAFNDGLPMVTIHREDDDG